MRKLKFRTPVLILFLLIFSSAFSQTAKKFFQSGEKFQEAKNYPEAITNYSKALDLDPNMEKAYTARALCYEQTGQKEKAADDYKRATAFSPKDKELYYNAGRLYFAVQMYKDANAMLQRATDLDDSYLEALSIYIPSLINVKDFKGALAASEKALNAKKNAVNYYNHAVALDSVGTYDAAEKDYKEAKYFDSKMIPAYVGLALVRGKLKKVDDGLKACEEGLAKAPEDRTILYARSLLYAQKNDFQNAVVDLSKVIVAEPENIKAFSLRAEYYHKLGQYQNAAYDYSKVINTYPKNLDAYFNRAACYEQLGNYREAARDYAKVQEIAPGNAQAQQMLATAKSKLFELNRERNRPEVIMYQPKSDDKNVMKLPNNAGDFVFKGKISDESPIKTISVNGLNAQFNKDTLNPEFTVTVNVAKSETIVITATDVYDNTQKNTYGITHTETDKPAVALLAPYTSFDNEIFLDNTNPELYIEGKVKDESPIQSVIIEGSNASFSLTEKDPTFSAKISIANKNSITIKVKDIYDNETVQEYKITRDASASGSNNPMGTTWAVFIENSAYQNFSSLEGPGKDVTMIKAALSNYRVSKVVHKKNMGKADLEKFFSIELRDLVKANNVKSIVIWYAGHGKFQNQTGYWIPVDAKADDEFTYFSVSNLKASLQAYTWLVHTLVVTDACESGPAFYLAMRGDAKEARCENWEQTKFKSAQVFTSAGYELASDNSQFSKTFASMLNNNPNACIAIEKIAEKVIAAVKQAGGQSPKLGKINGLEDEGGTFFFMKK